MKRDRNAKKNSGLFRFIWTFGLVVWEHVEDNPPTIKPVTRLRSTYPRRKKR